MLPRVVNVKVKYIRPYYHDLQQWCQDSNNVYIGRGRIVIINGIRYPPNDSIFANPFKLPGDVINQYRHYILNRLHQEPQLRQQLVQLQGKNIGCWCAEYDRSGVRLNPGQYHGDILVEILASFIR